MEKDMLPGKLWHRRQGGDGQCVETITMRRSSSTSESSTRCVIDGNVEVGHRRVAAPVMNMCGSSTRCVINDNIELSHRQVAASVKNMWQQASNGGTRGEGIGGAPLVEASGDGGNRRDKIALAAISVLQRRHRRRLASREK
ncbi:hypothetical protein VPH35_017970 [Triticum aestivum]